MTNEADTETSTVSPTTLPIQGRGMTMSDPSYRSKVRRALVYIRAPTRDHPLSRNITVCDWQIPNGDAEIHLQTRVFIV